jgi:Protein of unknown function (DUF3592)
MRAFDPWKLLPFWREIGLVLIAASTSIWTWFKFRQAHSWPSAQGTIVGAAARASGGGHSQGWAGEFTYTYVVDGQYYSGFHRIKARSERRAEEKVAGWKGRMVIVRYSPDKHDLSTLLKADQPGGQLGN